MLRGFFALEQTRTVFWIQCVIAATNVAAALLLVREATAEQTSPALVVAYGLSYVVGAAVSATVLARRLRGGGNQARTLAGFGVRLLGAALPAAAAGYVVGRLLGEVFGPDPAVGEALLRAVVVTLVDVAGFVLLARLVRLREVTAVLDLVARRGSSRGRDGSDLP
jgi:putative peptidoglycan lipid II flippase